MSEAVVENVGGEWGYTVTYTPREWAVDFVAVEIIGRTVDTPDAPLYHKEGSPHGAETVDDVAAADSDVHGWVKWDGCSHFYFGEEDGYLHLCGRSQIDKLAALLPVVYERCGALMSNRDRDRFAQ